MDKIEEIHNSLLNGQRRQLVEQIKEYGLYDFFADYQIYLLDTYETRQAQFEYFSDVTISFFRIENR